MSRGSRVNLPIRLKSDNITRVATGLRRMKSGELFVRLIDGELVPYWRLEQPERLHIAMRQARKEEKKCKSLKSSQSVKREHGQGAG